MPGEELAIRLDELDVDEVVALRLDAAQDLTGEVADDAVGLDEDEGLFYRGHDLPI